jgi:hypothetical protein
MSEERWQVTGSAAEVYQRQLVPAIFAPWAPRVLDRAAPATGEHLLDTACGTGVVARPPWPSWPGCWPRVAA